MNPMLEWLLDHREAVSFALSTVSAVLAVVSIVMSVIML